MTYGRDIFVALWPPIMSVLSHGTGDALYIPLSRDFYFKGVFMFMCEWQRSHVLRGLYKSQRFQMLYIALVYEQPLFAGDLTAPQTETSRQKLGPQIGP